MPVATHNEPASSTRSTSDALRTITRILLIAAGFIGAGFSYAGAFVAGTSWDAPYDTSAAQAFFTLPDGLTLKQAYAFIPEISEYYGVLFFQLVDVLGSLVGTTEILDPRNPESYVWQGLANTTLAVVTIAIFSMAVGYATKSSFAGTATWATVMTLPLWVGMSHMNFKDMPVASGLSLLSAGLIFAHRRGREGHIGTLAFALAPISIGSFLAVGTRVGAIVLVIAIVGLSTAWWVLLAVRRKTLPQVIQTTVMTGIGLAASIVMLWLTNPVAHIDTPRLIFDSIRVSGSFPIDFTVRVAGVDVATTNLPLWYAPAWVAAQLPLTLWVCLLVCLALAVPVARKFGPAQVTRGAGNLFPLLAQAFVLPALIIVSGATLYDGIRHLLFAVPAGIAILMVLLRNVLSPWDQRQLAGVTLAALIFAGVIFNIFALARWFPYSYAFINPIAGANAPDRDWELDYWGVSAREGVERLRETGASEVIVIPNADMAVPYGGSRASDSTAPPARMVGFYAFLRFGAELPNASECTDTFTIERDRQVLGVGGICPL